METKLPQQLQVSRWARLVEQRINPEKPLLLLCHELSGEVLKVNRETANFVEFLRARGKVSRRSLLSSIENESHSVISLLHDRGILVEGDETTDFLNRYPYVAHGAISFKDRGRQVFVSHRNSVASSSQYELILRKKEEPLLSYCNGERTLAEILRLTKISTDDLTEILARLTHPNFQILRLLKNPKSLELHGAQLGFFIEDWCHSEETLQSKRKSYKDGAIDLKEFHKTGIQDALLEFNEIETTVSHAFRFPSEALGGRSYGAAFFAALKARRMIQNGHDVVEVGGGTGIFSREFLREARKHSISLKYRIVDLSPTLQQSQKQIHNEEGNDVGFILRNAESLSLRKCKADLIISNEVIADFRTVKLSKNKKSNSLAAEAWSRIRKYGLSTSGAGEEFYFNLGAVKFLENCHANLRSGGELVITEFGSLFSYPEATHHLNHDEYSIQWGHMLQATRAIGFEFAEIVDLGAFIPFDQNVLMLEGEVTDVNYVLRKFGRNELAPAAYSKSEFELAMAENKDLHIRGYRFSPFYFGDYWGPSVSEFKALIARK